MIGVDHGVGRWRWSVHEPVCEKIIKRISMPHLCFSLEKSHMAIGVPSRVLPNAVHQCALYIQ